MMQDYIKGVYSFFFDTIQTILIAASVFLVIYIFLMRPFEVSGESMFPTFKNGEYILTNLVSKNFGDLQRGDVIVFKSPTDENKDFIKRVIGVPGDTVSIKDFHVYVNGNLLDESEYLSDTVRTSNGHFLQDGRSITVPADNFFVMGDNRPHSSDSREWGLLPKSELIGSSFFVYWPPQDMRIVTNPFEK